MAINQLKAGAVLNYIIIGLNTIVGLAYTPYMLRCLGQNEYGLYSLVASVIAYLTLLDFGFGNAIVRYTAKFRAEQKTTEQWEMFGMFLIVYSLIGLIAFGGGLALYFNVDILFDRTLSIAELRQARIMMLLLTLNLTFTFPLSIFGSIITAYEHFVFPRIVNILRILLSTTVMIGLLTIGFKAISLVVVQTIFNLLVLVSNYIFAKHKLQIRIIFNKFNFTFFKEIMSYSFWIFINAIIDKIYWSTGQFILGAYVGTAAVAVYSIGILFQQMFMSFSFAFSSVLLPKLTTMVTQNKTDEEIFNIFIRTGRLQSYVLQFILSGFIVFGNLFILKWAGNGYNESFMITLLFMIALYIPAIQSTGLLILQARNELKFRTITYLFISIFSILFQIYLSKICGAIGCAIAVSGALIIGQGLIINLYYNFKQRLNIVYFWKSIIKMLIPTVLLTLTAILLLSKITVDSMPKLLLSIVLYTIVYLPATFYLCLGRDDREMILKPILMRIHKL